MLYKEIKVKIKDDGVPYVFQNKSFVIEDNMLIVDDTSTSSYCFPIENVLYYRFERYQ